MAAVDFLDINVRGRPAPQGSKRLGESGQLLEVSPYLRPWRSVLKRAVRQRFHDLGITMDDLRERPVFVGPVAFGCTFWMATTGQRIDGPPDLDKLVRAVWDELTKNRVWEDDARVTEVLWLAKRFAGTGAAGADMVIQEA